ncbi:MAG: PQQ-dependent sugar dehydrogenase [Bacillota bacterium]|nr:PQQ-dependent sugar dehydrogenase [Bacillota bacterium]
MKKQSARSGFSKHRLLLVVLLAAFTLSSCGINQSASSTQSPTITSQVTTPSATPAATTTLTTETTRTSETSETKETTRPAPTPTERTLLPPVENNPPNTAYEPAFAGQTRAPGIATATPYSVTILTEDLNRPWAVTALPDGRLMITETAGTLRIVTTDGQVSRAIGGFPQVDDRSQGGLLDVAPAPDFISSRLIYVTLAEMTSQGSLTAVGRGRLSDDESQVENFEIIWRALPYYNNSMHFGSRLAFDQAGNLFVTTGERSDLTTRPKAQLLDNGYGKVVYITPDGDLVPGNPFVGVAGAQPEIYSYGHRNIQGLAIHPITGDVWVSEMGPRGGDELNRIKAGGNYGWPVISYGIEYSGSPIPGALTAKEGMEQPVYYWDPVLAPGGMTFYTTGVIAEWQNDLFIGGLRGQHIARIVLEDGRVVAEERLLADEGQRFRDIGEGTDGALYAVTDSGRLYRIG